MGTYTSGLLHLYKPAAGETSWDDEWNANLDAIDLGATTVPANVQTDSYTLVLTDAGKCVELNKATAVTLTVPPNSSVPFPIGTVILVTQYGAGRVSVDNGASVTLRAGLPTILRAQYSTVTLRKRDTDEWVITGDLTQIVDIGTVNGWYKADALVLNDTDPVATWTDSSGQGNNLTSSGANQPLYRTDQVNGLPALVSDGADDWIGTWTDLNPLTVIIVAKNLTGGEATGRFWDLSGSSGLFDDAGVFTYYANEADAPVDLVITNTAFHIVSVVYTSATVAKAYVDGVLKATFDPKNTYSTGGFEVVFGSDMAGNNSVKAAVPEFLMSTAALVDGERRGIERSFGAKYGITFT